MFTKIIIIKFSSSDIHVVTEKPAIVNFVVYVRDMTTGVSWIIEHKT